METPAAQASCPVAHSAPGDGRKGKAAPPTPYPSGGPLAPGPNAWESVSYIVELARSPQQFWRRLHREYGDIVRFQVGGECTYSLFDPEDIEYVIETNANNYSRHPYQLQTLRPFVGDGFADKQGSLWPFQKSALSGAAMEAQIRAMGVEATAVLQRFERYARSGERVDLVREMANILIKSVARGIFEVELSDKDVETIYWAGRKTVQAASYRLVTRIPLSWPTPGNWSLWDAIRPKNRIFSRIVEMKRKSLNGDGAPRDYLSKLIQGGKDAETGEPFSPALLRDIAAGVIGPNFLNTALTSSWVWSQLSQHPHARTRVEEELSQVLRGELPTLPQLRHLTYTQMAIKEAMRFQSSAYAFSRQAIGPDKVRGYYIPAGAAVAVPCFLIHRDPRYWENPLGFDPERFTPERSAGRPRYAYCPWGGGNFKCTGKELGMAEVMFIVATIAQRFRINLVGDHEVKVDERMMLLAPYEGPFVTIQAKGTA